MFAFGNHESKTSINNIMHYKWMQTIHKKNTCLVCNSNLNSMDR